ncbi:XTP/dITP diphosphatase [Ligilactobacillus ruminis]|uniref:dITP/XTP pyrophosphatase n=1 Tax=Ligilactobacillus ruminis TaxID=1623 RepID=A0AAQ2XKV4_9LACO|nr:XTP/dITP diphosphatase [Ligilactobacillus ruminis]WDC82145.1 XTP/dITP diphosphatase [Ligilactobacillus ruminis]
MTKILIATKNDGKAREYCKLFEPKGIEVITLKDLNEQVEIIENGKTFSENALIKAQTLTDKLNIPALADDSGLVVDALNGAPGIYSARYAGDHDDEANNKKLLEALKKVPDEKRTAHFHCSIVATAPDKTPLEANGDVYGLIAHEKHGEDGFGYDPLFYYPEFGKTFGEIGMEEKNKVSHRAKATENLLEKFDEWWNE